LTKPQKKEIRRFFHTLDYINLVLYSNKYITRYTKKKKKKKHAFANPFCFKRNWKILARNMSLEPTHFRGTITLCNVVRNFIRIFVFRFEQLNRPLPQKIYIKKVNGTVE
jgi:hypothetical protein